jgi:hypothetical protein
MVSRWAGATRATCKKAWESMKKSRIDGVGNFRKYSKRHIYIGVMNTAQTPAHVHNHEHTRCHFVPYDTIPSTTAITYTILLNALVHHV